jgi:Outer membrane efflux protein
VIKCACTPMIVSPLSRYCASHFLSAGRVLRQLEHANVQNSIDTTRPCKRRPDIRAAEENLLAQKALVSAAKKAFFPRISLTGLLGFQSDQLSRLFTGPSRAWTFVPQVTQPLFTGGRLKSDVRFAKAQQQLAVIQIPANCSKCIQRGIRRSGPISKG